MTPLDFSKGAEISMCPKLNTSLASRVSIFVMKPMSDGPTLGIYLMEILSASFFMEP